MKRQARDTTQRTDSTRTTVDACMPYLGPLRDDTVTDPLPAPSTVPTRCVDAAPITQRMVRVAPPPKVHAPASPAFRGEAWCRTMASAPAPPARAKRPFSVPPPLPVDLLAATDAPTSPHAPPRAVTSAVAARLRGLGARGMGVAISAAVLLVAALCILLTPRSPASGRQLPVAEHVQYAPAQPMPESTPVGSSASSAPPTRTIVVSTPMLVVGDRPSKVAPVRSSLQRPGGQSAPPQLASSAASNTAPDPESHFVLELK